jgi:hypothetical protein
MYTGPALVTTVGGALSTLLGGIGYAWFRTPLCDLSAGTNGGGKTAAEFTDYCRDEFWLPTGCAACHSAGEAATSIAMSATTAATLGALLGAVPAVVGITQRLKGGHW